MSNSDQLAKWIEYKFDAMNHKDSGFSDGDKFYPLKDMLQAIKDQKSIKEKVYLNSMNHRERWKDIGAIEMAEHYLRIKNADISKPIIMHYTGMIIDGYHRIAKAIVMKKEYLWAYRIDLTKLTPKTIIK